MCYRTSGPWSKWLLQMSSQSRFNLPFSYIECSWVSCHTFQRHSCLHELTSLLFILKMDWFGLFLSICRCLLCLRHIFPLWCKLQTFLSVFWFCLWWLLLGRLLHFFVVKFINISFLDFGS
jgi:hypothetical protein